MFIPSLGGEGDFTIKEKMKGWVNNVEK